MATESNLLGDDRIGEYRFVRTLFAGQNSTVMEVAQDSTGRRFVIKQMAPGKASSGAERKAFAFEAKLGMALRHPNLIQVHEFVKDREQPYFVMEYFPSIHMGMAVAKPDKYGLARGRLHGVIAQAAAGLSYLHSQGWIHRDLKPSNIIANKSGEARLIDYALALRPYSFVQKLLRMKPPRAGTPSYLSPEQIRREPPTFASDVYSFGITCYELACGRQPFRANSQGELLNKHLKDQPLAPTTYNAKITPEFSDLVLSMLRKQPADRLGSLEEFQRRFARTRIYSDDPDPQADRP